MRPSKRDDEELALLGLIGLGIADEELSLFTSEATGEDPSLLKGVETDSDDEVLEMRHMEAFARDEGGGDASTS